ncbi:hypothetical protein [Amycolatopsis minnesotensis]|uniref:YjbR protein n=1 Tax=Amycolatopsis minnesotensis TaxID=337894 RepID=A0ABN2R159_9PSEU
MNDKPQSIGEKQLADADTDVIWQQLGRPLLMELGARDLVYMDDGVMFRFGPNSPVKLRKIIVKLNGSDLYEVEVGYLQLPSYEWNVIEQVSDVYADSLPEVVRRLSAKAVDA